MNEERIEEILLAHNIRPTANRIIIAKALANGDNLMSMKVLEQKILTIDKSNIFRTLTLFKKHHLVHQVEEGNGMVGYELCLSHSDDKDDDLHVHFYCKVCHNTVCLPKLPIPPVSLPNEYIQHEANYVVKGICPQCAKKIKK